MRSAASGSAVPLSVIQGDAGNREEPVQLEEKRTGWCAWFLWLLGQIPIVGMFFLPFACPGVKVHMGKFFELHLLTSALVLSVVGGMVGMMSPSDFDHYLERGGSVEVVDRYYESGFGAFKASIVACWLLFFGFWVFTNTVDEDSKKSVDLFLKLVGLLTIMLAMIYFEAYMLYLTIFFEAAWSIIVPKYNNNGEPGVRREPGVVTNGWEYLVMVLTFVIWHFTWIRSQFDLFKRGGHSYVFWTKQKLDDAFKDYLASRVQKSGNQLAVDWEDFLECLESESLSAKRNRFEVLRLTSTAKAYARKLYKNYEANVLNDTDHEFKDTKTSIVDRKMSEVL
mmetsp:Transcript_33305/g.61924  ORF Transcript_33305/g.61924 Transcript_33305/m.61924 type:complete len:338 (-) Transcript_33305:71-1084(-)